MKSPFEPYVIETDRYGLNEDLAPELVAAAAELPVYDSTFERVVGDEREDARRKITTECLRCQEDDVVIWPDELLQRVAHLTLHHGWRMDGHRYDGNNRMVAAS